MSKIPLQPYKGFRDFYPADKQLQNWIFLKWREVCNNYGYQEYTTPIIEPLQLFSSKTSEEIVKDQTFSFEDRGGRLVTLRPEMTPSVSRLVAQKQQELGYPLRLFSIPNCFRYERMQRGRLREFWQLNADIFGVSGIEAEAELILLADQLMKAFGASDEMYEIRVNSRKHMNSAIENSGTDKPQEVVRLIDKIDKMTKDNFNEELGKLVKTPAAIREYLDGSIMPERLQELAELLKEQQVSLIYDPSIARGFDYYTDIVFEVFDTSKDNNRSMFGGGRYDGLVEKLGGKSLDTVGFGMGDVTLELFLKENDLLPDLSSNIDAVFLPIEIEKNSTMQSAEHLRTHGLAVAVDYSTDRKLDSRIKSAVKNNIEFGIIVGENELSEGTVTIKNFLTREQETLSVNAATHYLLNLRKQNKK